MCIITLLIVIAFYINIMTNIVQRFISGGLLGAIILLSILYSDTLFNLILLTISMLMYYEWYNMTKSDILFAVSGIAIIFIPIFCLYQVSSMNYGKMAILLYALIIASVDSFAMFVGKLVGGQKLAPKISPNKTWSGFFGGVGSAIIVSVLGYFFIKEYNVRYNIIEFILFGGLIAAIEQCSDLFISIFKRKFGIKDTGSIIPGHGGALDRFDGIILTAPLLLLLVSLGGMK